MQHIICQSIILNGDLVMKTIIFYPFIKWYPNRIERWLKKKSENGYKLVGISGCRFTFVQTYPREREYYIYSSPLFNKYDKFISEYYSARDRYSLKKSEINKGLNFAFEVDINKIDKDFYSYRLTRNKHYSRYYYKFLLFGLLCSIFFFPLAFVENTFVLLLIISICVLINSIIALCFISKDKKDRGRFSVLKEKTKK